MKSIEAFFSKFRGQSFRTHKNNTSTPFANSNAVVSIFLSVFLLLLTAFGTFVALKGPILNNSELAFTEHSNILGDRSGSVIPASCPSASHVPNDCTTICQDIGGLWAINTHYDPPTNSCMCNNGSDRIPICDFAVTVGANPPALPPLPPTVQWVAPTPSIVESEAPFTIAWNTLAGAASKCKGSFTAASVDLPPSGTFTVSGKHNNVNPAAGTTINFSIACQAPAPDNSWSAMKTQTVTINPPPYAQGTYYGQGAYYSGCCGV
jgi:hypothetical protein